MRWFRLYSDLLHDPKAQRLNPALFKHWINLLCLANVSEPRGVLPVEQDIAFALRVRPFEMRKIMTQLVDAGLIERREDGRFTPHNWDGRQPPSDDINERVRRHRAQNAPENGREIDALSAPNQRAINAPSTGTRRKVGVSHTADAASFLETAAIRNGNVTLHDTLQKRPVDTDVDTDTKGKIASNEDVVGATPPVADADLSSLCASIAKAAGITEKRERLQHLIEQHPALDAKSLIFQAEMAAEWIADTKQNKRKREMNVRFLHNWYVRAEKPQEETHGTTSSNGTYPTGANGRGQSTRGYQTPAPADTKQGGEPDPRFPDPFERTKRRLAAGRAEREARTQT